MIYTMQYDSPIGPIIMAGDGESFTGLWFVGQKYFGSTLPGDFCRQAAWRKKRLCLRWNKKVCEFINMTSEDRRILVC